MDRERANGSVTNRLKTPTVRVFLLSTIALFGCSCAGTQKSVTQNGEARADSIRNAEMDWFYGVHGFTLWSCNKAEPIWFPRDQLVMTDDPRDLRAVAVHEESHKAFMLSLPGCEYYHDWVADAENRLTLEAVALCAEVRQRVKDGHPDPDGMVNRSAQTLARRLAAINTDSTVTYTHDRVMARVKAVCR